jgi:hypothetical protein
MSRNNDQQRALVAAARAESFLDRSEPLGYTSPSRPEYGLTPSRYYKLKHGPNGPGSFWPLHQMKWGQEE